MKENIDELRLLKTLVIEALNMALFTHDMLGVAGIKKDTLNRFGEMALRGDIRCEKAVIAFMEGAMRSIRIISEEHGTVDLSDTPRYLAVLDGIDGSAMYEQGFGINRYGTPFSIFDGEDPAYGDYLVSGYMEHATKRLFIAVKGQGAFVIEGDTQRPIRTSGKKELGDNANIYVDEYFEFNRATYSKPLAAFRPNGKPFYAGTSASVHFASVASGEADLNLRCSCKGNLEPAACFGLITEAGGVMVDAEGNSLADKKYLVFGQNEQIPIITAATPELARNLIAFLEKP